MKKKMLVGVGLLVVACIVLFLIIAISSGGEDSSTKQEGETRNQTELVGPICQGTPLADARAYTQTSGIHPLVILERKEDGHYDYGFENLNTYEQPDGWRSRYVETLELVVCVDEQEDELAGTCEYTLEDSSETATLSVHFKQVSVRLVEAQTGQEIAAGTFVGETECPETMQVTDSSTGNAKIADGNRELEEWLRPYVEIP